MASFTRVPTQRVWQGQGPVQFLSNESDQKWVSCFSPVALVPQSTDLICLENFLFITGSHLVVLRSDSWRGLGNTLGFEPGSAACMQGHITSAALEMVLKAALKGKRERVYWVW